MVKDLTFWRIIILWPDNHILKLDWVCIALHHNISVHGLPSEELYIALVHGPAFLTQTVCARLPRNFSMHMPQEEKRAFPVLYLKLMTPPFFYQWQFVQGFCPPPHKTHHLTEVTEDVEAKETAPVNGESKDMNRSPYPDFSPSTEGLSMCPQQLTTESEDGESKLNQSSTVEKLLSESPAPPKR